MNSDIIAQAKKYHTHTVIFTVKTVDETVLKEAQSGMSTKYIAEKTGLSEAQVQYRISKGQNLVKRRFRQEFRNGGGLAPIAVAACGKAASRFVQTHITPKLLPFAASRVNQ